MVAPVSLSSQAESETAIWERRRKYYKDRQSFFLKRMNRAFFVGVAISIAILLAFAIYAFLNEEPTRLQFFDKAMFTEWRVVGEPIPVDTPFGELGRAALGLYEVGLVVFLGNSQHIAGVARAISIPIIGLIALFFYRRDLLHRYDLEEREAQKADFISLKSESMGCYFLLTRIFFFLSTVFGIYVFSSIVLFTSSLLFLNLSLSYFWAAIFIAVFCGALATLAVFRLVAIDTREILLLGLGTWLGGLALSFALVNNGFPVDTERILYWWCSAVSDAGYNLPSAPIFTASFASAFLAFFALWFDIDSILAKFIRKVIEEFDPAHPEKSELSRFAKWFLSKLSAAGRKQVGTVFRWIIPILYFIMLVGLIGVGFVRTDGSFGNEIAHTGGIVLTVVCILILTLLTPKKYFNLYYDAFSYGYVGILVMLGIAYVVGGDLSECKGGIITLVGLELAALVFVVLWIYTTLDNLVIYANTHWDGLRDYS